MKKFDCKILSGLQKLRKTEWWKVMRIVLLLMTIGITQALALESYAQDTRLSLNVENQPIQEILEIIEEKSEFRFMYDATVVDVSQKRSINCQNQPITKILDNIFEGSRIIYKVEDRQIALSNSDAIFDFRQVSQQQRTISGKVTDANGQPLPGVTVVMKGTTQGTVTDADGVYSLTNIPENATLVFSFVGMRTQEVVVGTRTNVSVTMEELTIGLDEVIAIGYGSVRKSDLTGSVSSVEIEELQAIPITSIDQGLGGRAAGVMVTQTSGMPGSIASLRIRGINSLEGGNEPLYVIDGFPVYNGSGFGDTGGRSQYSGLSLVNPSDIESMEILKDASATAIYGARAANGVVLITTKKGQVGTDRITFDASYGVQNVTKKIDVMNALQLAELVNEARANDGLAPFYNESQMQTLRKNPKGTDWQDEIFRSAPTQDYVLTFSGGDHKLLYSISANYTNQEGIIRGSDFERYLGRINFERKLLNNFKVGTNMNLSKTISNAVTTNGEGYEIGVVSTALKFNPNLPVYSNEELKEYTLMNDLGIPYPNPVATANELTRENQAVRILGNIYGEWEIIPNLIAKISLGTDIFNTKRNVYIPSNIIESDGIGTGTVGGNYTTNWLNENTLTWNKELNENHKISLLGGITFQKEHFESVTASSQDFVNDILKFNSLQSGAVYNQPSTSSTDWSLISYLGRIDYNVKERYLFSLSARADGSSRFGKNNKFAILPSGAFAWRLIEEDFIKKMGIFSNLKLRISYGTTGNQEIGLYQSLPTLGSTTYTFGRDLSTGFFPNSIPNADLKWEKTNQFDVGMDLGFINNRLRVTTDYYKKTTVDLLYSVAVPFTSGFSNSLTNIGSIENRGLELSIESDNFTGIFNWTTSFNISFNKNKVLELGGEEYKDAGLSEDHVQISHTKRLFVGEPVGLFYGYVFDGIIQNDVELAAAPLSQTNWIGGRRYKDLGGPDGIPDGVIDATYDRTVIGNPNPDFFGGISNNLSYKGFELSVFMQYSYGNDIFNMDAVELTLPSGGQNVYSELVDRWTPTNPSNKYPVATTNRSALMSDLYIEDGSYLKIKTISLGYTFPKIKLKHISDLKFSVTAHNFLTFTNYKGFDPDVSYAGVTNIDMGTDYGGYPQAKALTFNVRFNVK